MFRDPALRIGLHVGKGKTIYDTITQEKAHGTACVQFFLGDRLSSFVPQVSINDINRTKKISYLLGRSIYIHCPYSANLTNGLETFDINKWISTVQEILNRAKALNGAPVLHMGTKGTSENLQTSLDMLNITSRLLLENQAGGGAQIGTSVDEIRKIFEGIDSTYVELCLDTCHAFASGMCSFQGHEDVTKMMEDLPVKPSLIHLNDSKAKFGSRLDRHECIGDGCIWKGSTEGLDSLVSWCKEYHVDMVLETPDSTRDLYTIMERYN